MYRQDDLITFNVSYGCFGKYPVISKGNKLFSFEKDFKYKDVLYYSIITDDPKILELYSDFEKKVKSNYY